MEGIYTGCPRQITYRSPEEARYLDRIRKLSKEAKLRLRWFDHCQKTKNASLACRYFGISRKTFYEWKKDVIDGTLLP